MEKDNRTSQELLKEFMENDTFKQQEKLIAEREKTLKSGDNVVHLQYLGVFEDDDLQKINEILEKAKLDLSSYNSSGVMQNSFDSYTFIAFLAINQPLIIELLKGLGTNATWDIIKETVFFVRNKIKGKKINKITSTTVEEKDITFGLKVNLDRNTSFDFELKGNVSDEVIGQSLDRVLSFLKDKKLNDCYQYPDFLKYSEKENKWIKIDVMEEIRTKSKKKK
jgi:hypothetical protein